MKESFIIYTSFYDPIKSLSDKQLGRIFRALFDYRLEGEVQVEDDIKMAFLFFKNQMDIDEQRYNQKIESNKQNGSKGGAPKGNKNAQKNNRNNRTVEKTTKTTLNDNDNDLSNTISCEIDITTNTTSPYVEDSISSFSEIVDDTISSGKNQSCAREKKPRKSDSPMEPTVVDLKTCVVSGNEWRENFSSYKSALRKCYMALKNDAEWLAERKRLNPRVDVPLTLEKACIEFWATEAGWKHKKKEKSKTIDWKATLTNSISSKFNRIYENDKGNNQIDRGRVSDDFRRSILENIGAI